MNKQLPTLSADARKEKHRLNRFPNISRIINEEFAPLILGASFVMLLAIFIVSYSLFDNTKRLNELTAEREALIEERTGWQSILLKYPDYRDGYLKLSNVEYMLGEKETALRNIYKALEIDPNFHKALEFETFFLSN